MSSTPHPARPLWHRHPGVRSGAQLSFGERAADHMKAIFATWTALIAILFLMLFWMVTSGLGSDPEPYILLNLVLSCIAALQCFILLIAAKRADQISSELAVHDNTLLEENTTLTRESAFRTILLHRLCEKFDVKHDDVLAALADPNLPCPAV